MLELYTTSWCPYCAQLREELAWKRRNFVEYDVETDSAARGRLAQLCDGALAVPVLVEEGRVLQSGYEGRSCYARAGA